MRSQAGLVGIAIAALAVVAACPPASAASGGAGLWIGATPAPWVESHVEIDVRLGVAHGTVRQRFRNPTDQAAEAIYVFPLPPGAAVTAMRVDTGGDAITARIAPRPTAQRAYEAALAGGRAAALTERERPGVYTQSIAGVRPGTEVAITLSWQARLERKGGVWELAHPMVVGPRHVPGVATGLPTRGGGTAVDTDRAPDASRVTPPARGGAATPFSFVIRLDDAGVVESPSHDLDVADDGGARVVRVSDSRGSRELVVRWRGQAAAGVRAVVEPAGKGAYVAVLVEREVEAARPRQTPRTWLVALDRSASLDGPAALAAAEVANGLIERMRPDDRLAVVAIGERPSFAIASAAARTRARAAVAGGRAGTGDLTAGLAVTLAGLPRAPDTAVVLVTDGLVADDTAAIERAVAAGVVVHTVGVGAAPNRWLLEAIAERTGGTAHVVSSLEEAPVLADALVRAEPPLAVAVDWKRPRVTDGEPARPQVLAGGAILVVAIDRGGVPSGEVEVAIGGQRLRAPLTRVGGSALATEWARQRVARLWAAGDHDGATRLAVERGVVSPTTALVAVGATGGAAVRSTVTVPVPLPAGFRPDAVGRDAGGDDDRDGGADPRGDGSIQVGAGGGAATGATAAPEPAPADREALDEDGGGYRRAPSPGVQTSEHVLARAVSRRFLTAGLTLGARVDEPAPAAVLSLEVAQRVTPRTAVGLRLELGLAPSAEAPVTAALLLDVSRWTLRALALDLGAGLAWGGEGGGVGLGYRAGVGVLRGPWSLGLRVSGAVTAERAPATVGVGVDAAF